MDSNYMTRDEFKDCEAYRSMLSEVLKLPAIVAALDIVRREGVRPLPEPISGVDFSAQVAAHGAKYNGWCESLNALESLVRGPLKHTVVGQQSDMYNQEAVERLKASRIYSDEEIKQFNK